MVANDSFDCSFGIFFKEISPELEALEKEDTVAHAKKAMNITLMEGIR